MSISRFGARFLTLALLSSFAAAANDSAVLHKIDNLPASSSYDKIIDTRPLASCRQASLSGAICLPVEDVLAPQQRLANWSGIYWLLGSAGLGGHEHVLVIGEQPDRRDFIAGLLLIAGQKAITVVEKPASVLLQPRETSAAGQPRASTRTAIYTAHMRSDRIVLQNELKTHLADNRTILDGRIEAEYHGARIRAARGGHIPGAQHSPLAMWRHGASKNASLYADLQPIAYAHNPYDSLVYFAALQAAGVQASVYLAGWTEWAANGALPIDSASYATHPIRPVATPASTSGPDYILLAGLTGAIALLLALAFYSGKSLARRPA